MVTVVDRWNIQPCHPWLRGIRPDRPVEFKEEMGAWNVWDYQDVFEVLNDPKTFSSKTYELAAVRIDETYSKGDFAQMDPPEQTKYRKLVSRAFTSRTIAALEPRVVEIAAELLDEMMGKERVELVMDLAYPLPVIVIAEMLGVPAEDRELFKKHAFLILEQLNGMSFLSPDEDAQQLVDAAVDRLQPMMEYMRGQIAEHRSRPRDDMISALIEAEVDGERLDDDEILTIANFILVAGHITTTMLIGNTVLCLDSNPEVFERVRADRSLVPTTLEESLRMLTITAAVTRRSTTEVELSGVTIPPEQMIIAWPGAANRDPRKFDNPEVFDPARDPNPHLGFGHGVHYCIGAGLARLGGRVALNALLDRFPVLHTDPNEPPRFFPTPDIVGTSFLPLRTHP